MKKLTDYPDSDLRIFERPPLPSPELLQSVFLIGICGTGMGSLATLFAEAGYTVSGSDQAAYPPMSVTLANQGIQVSGDFSVSNLARKPDLIVVGNSCTPRHVEAAFARDHSMVQSSFPEALAHYFIRNKKSIVVAGTHGKTTTTSLLVHVFRMARINPGYLVGGIMGDQTPNAASGLSDYFLVEGDEYDSAYFDKRPKFMHYRPSSAIVTSVEFDHADIYESPEDYVDAFESFVKLLPSDGFLALNGDDATTVRLAAHTKARVCLYGFGAESTVRASRVRTDQNGQTFELFRSEKSLGRFHLPMHGRHNLSNALAVSAIALDEGISIKTLSSALASFAGIQRRQQVLGEERGVIVVDDFAHHPTAVRATIEACRERWPERRIVAIFEPRSNSSRRKVFETGYLQAFSDAGAAFLKRPPFRHNDRRNDFMDIDGIVNRLCSRGVHAFSAETVDELLSSLLEFLHPGDVALIMSNGGFADIHRRLLTELQDLAIS